MCDGPEKEEMVCEPGMDARADLLSDGSKGIKVNAHKNIFIHVYILLYNIQAI